MSPCAEVDWPEVVLDDSDAVLVVLAPVSDCWELALEVLLLLLLEEEEAGCCEFELAAGVRVVTPAVGVPLVSDAPPMLHAPNSNGSRRVKAIMNSKWGAVRLEPIGWCIEIPALLIAQFATVSQRETRRLVKCLIM